MYGLYNKSNGEETSRPLSVRIYTFLVAFLIIGDVYVVPHATFLSWGLLFMVIASPYFILKGKPYGKVTSLYIPVLLFVAYSIIVSLIGSLTIDNSSSDIIVRLIREGFFYLIIFPFGIRFFDYTIFKKWISKIVMLLAIFVIMQAVVFYISGYLIPGLIPNVQINDSGYSGKQMYDSLIIYARYHGFIKVNGFLCEPAHCAHYFFIYLLILLFDKEEEKLWPALVLSVAMIATMSTSAFLQLAIAWGAWLFINGKKRILQAVVVVIIAIVGFYLISMRDDNSSFLFVIQRFTSVFTESETISATASSSLRITKGVEIFESLPILYKIIGIGFGAFDAAFLNGIITSSTVDLSNEYMSSLFYILTSAGVVGFLVYLSFFVNIFRSRNILGKMLIISAIIVFFGTSVYCTAVYVWLMLIVIHDQKRTEKF